MAATRRSSRISGIAGRLIVAMVLVVLAGGLTAWLVASAVGPGVFRVHMEHAEQTPGSVAAHAEEAFVSASTVTLAVALGASVATSLVVSLFLSRRIGASLGSMSAVAAQVAAGRFDVRVVPPRIGAEFDDLAEAFNQMGTRLDQNETMRRRLMADVAHELRTPVATIAGYLDAIEEGVEQLTPSTAEVLRSQASRLTRLAADLAAVTRAESGALPLALESADAGDLVAAAVDAARPSYESKGVALAGRVEDQLPPIAADRDRFGQVLGNLLENALRHTPGGGTVEIIVSRAHGGVRFAVVDTGEGIDAEHLPHVFERFYRVDTARDRGHGGSGVGLAIVRALVTAHGGTVSVRSDGPGGGTSFVIDVPPALAALRR
ncbi:two-component sensor histidine kinase [Xylanimonas oleitrophica]|uniref:histidine kinase n=1 Tax=Xylanimonas oleitrophica TaxID=2607479 RepID=A0A2W5WK96_9MICO|nr:ATP-binding protein [Xylanimonas oleitrophica]PZR51677.1 two-component sensor histidine kinase [Xylanimonas oleitrophica]